MAFIVEVPNPFEPLTNIRKVIHPGGISIREWLKEDKGADFQEFEVPTICILNGQPLMRKDWGYVIRPRDVINFAAIPQDPFTIIAVVVVAVIALTVVFFAMPKPTTPGEIPASDPVFTLKGQQNEVRLGEPIEACYGRNRIYPSLASRPYYQYIDNDQFQFSLYCLGQGFYEIAQLLISDTDISSYAEVEHEVIPPGNQVTLFPTNVFTSAEAGGQQLFGPNEADYIDPGWIGPFVANPAGSQTSDIQVDLMFPKGLYNVSDDGSVGGRSVIIAAEYQEINDVGTPIGGWSALPGFPTTVTAATTTPQRRTFDAPVALARYQVRLRRTNDTDLSTRSGNDAVWEGMRAYLDVSQDWGNITLIALKIRATNNLNSQSQKQFNVIATRKLYQRDPLDSSGPVATRSIIWAFVDVFRARYGGRAFSDGFFDWDALLALDTLYEDRDEHFDWIFRDPITVWEAAKTVARVGRAVPVLQGSIVTMRRDGPLEVPVTMFTPDNIIQNTFEWDIQLPDADEFDSVNMEYTEPATGYKQEQVLATLPGGTSDNPQQIRLPGCQDRAHAFREALFVQATQVYVREIIVFETGLEGLVVAYGDLVAVVHDAAKWGQAGYVVQAEVESSGATVHLWVSEPLRFEESGQYQILLRGRKGETIGPFDAFQTADEKQVLIMLASGDTVDFLLGGDTEPMLYCFGVQNNITQMCKITALEPQGGESIRVTCVADMPIIHTFDDLPVPPLATIPVPPAAPDLPIVLAVYLSQLPGTVQIVQASWLAAFGAQYYVVQASEDGTNWQNQGTVVRTAIQFQAHSGPLYVRVAAVNNGQGPWTQQSIAVQQTLIDLTGAWDGLSWTIGWWEVLNALSYNLDVFDHSSSPGVSKRTANLTDRFYTYDYAMALTDSNVVRDMRVEIDPVFAGGASGNPSAINLHNAIPTAPTGLSVTLQSVESDGVLYRFAWTVPHQDDLIRIALWVDSLDGFDPAIVSPVADETISSPGWAGIPVHIDYLVPFDSSAGHSEMFWRVGLFDVWGSEIETNLTAQQLLAAYP